MDFRRIAHRWRHAPEDKLPVICILGCKKIRLTSPVAEDHEEKRLDCRCYASDARLEQMLVRDRPHVIITVGNRFSYTRLIRAPFDVRRRWLHYDQLPDPGRLGTAAYHLYLKNLFEIGDAEDKPLVTVFTAAYRSGKKILRAFHSLREQTYDRWEWVIVDDSDDGGRTFKMLGGLAGQDHRIGVFKSWEHSGVIGEVKNRACSLAKGDILL
ncbi:MAG: glycosyltransferase, partial [Deltaproteobacteria bacterium]|nr:glycosyltransferase [Deltaproteobacteria bacterium]